MPELPEVEVVRAGLAPVVTGARVTGVRVLDERSLRRHDGPAEDFADRLTGRVLAEPQRRGKFMWVPLAPPPLPLVEPASLVEPVETTLPLVEPTSLVEPVETTLPLVEPVETTVPPVEPVETTVPPVETTLPPVEPVETTPSLVEPTSPVEPVETTALVTHLGMSGQVLLRPPGVEDARTRIVIDVEHPSRGAFRLNFVDQRVFGSMALDTLVPTPDGPDLVPSQVSHIARDPLDPLFDEAVFLSRLARRNTGIKRALLDQGLVSGIGNIYADESLWGARIHYEQPTSTLTRPRARALLAEVRAVLLRALAEGGTSFDEQYKNVNGNSGYFAHSLRAYGQQGRPCPRCGTPIVRVAFMNRGSHFCPRCQRPPRPTP